MYAGEFEELKEQRTLIENKEKIANALNEAHSILSGGEDTSGILEQLENACSSLENIVEYMPDTQDVLKRMQSTLYELEDCTSEISGFADSADSDIGNLEEIEDRIDLIQRLSRKYGSTIEEMLQFLDNSKRELEYLERYEENREQLKENCQKAFEKAEKLAENLSQKRRQISVQFLFSICPMWNSLSAKKNVLSTISAVMTLKSSFQQMSVKSLNLLPKLLRAVNFQE